MTYVPRPRTLWFAAWTAGILGAALCGQPIFAQEAGGWHASAEGNRYGGGPNAADTTPIGNQPAPVAGKTPPPAPASTRANVSKGSGTLPHDQGQVWREYDIRPYTSRVTTTPRPEQAIVDWILRQTGNDAWHSEPVGLLNANRDVLRVYHTPEIQAVVADIVDRFVNSAATPYGFTLRVATVTNPNWRSRAIPLMTPVPVQSPSVQGWILAKENARLLLTELSRRTDYREYNSAQQLVNNGQPLVISTMRPRTYMRGAIITQNAWPGYQPEMGTVEEGFTLEFTPLMSFDLASADAEIKLRLNQVEKMVPVKLELPTAVASNQRVQVDVPQMTMTNLHERFHWPADAVLLLSMGVVAAPGPTNSDPFTDAVTQAIPMLKDPPRADALMFLESVGRLPPSPQPAAAVQSAAVPQQAFQGRY